MRGLRIALAVILGFIVLTFLLSALGNCSGAEVTETSSSAVAPPTVAAADPAIRSVVVADGDLRVEALISTAWVSKDYPPQTALLVAAIGRAAQSGAADAGDASRLLLFVSAPSTDRLGREGEIRLYTLFFDMADLRAARFENLSLARTLNLATGSAPTREGLRVSALYCASDDGVDARTFCANLLTN